MPIGAEGPQNEVVEMGDPRADSVRLRRVSPLFNAEKIKVPLMVLQGANDPRVLKVESEEIVAAARKNGVAVEYVLFPDEGHGFVKKENQIRGYTGVIAFLDEFELTLLVSSLALALSGPGAFSLQNVFRRRGRSADRS